MMPNGDPRYGFFYPSLTLMMDSYNIIGTKILACVQTDRWKLIYTKGNNASSLFTCGY